MSRWTKYYKLIEPKAFATKVTDNQSIGDQGTYGNFSWYQRLIQGSASRLTRYREYDLCDADVECSRALDTIAEEMTGNQPKTDEPLIIKIDSQDSGLSNTVVLTLKTALKYWCKIHDLENKLFNISRTTVKYGDCFFKKKTIRQREQWEYIHPKNVVGAIVDQEDITNVLGWQIKIDSKKVRSSYGVPVSNTSSDIETELLPENEVLRFTLNDDMSEGAPFGDSVLGPVYRSHKQKELLEDAIIIYRIQRAPERRVFYIDVGKMPPQRVKTYLEQIKNEIKQKKVPNIHGGQANVDSVYNPQSMNEDFFFASRCLDLQEKIPLLDGRELTLEEIIKEYKEGKTNFVYSINQQTGKFIPGEIEWAGITRKNADLVKVHLDNGEYIKCTPDHKFVLRDGSEVEAQHLTNGTSLMPLYRKKMKTNKNQQTARYERIFDNSTGKWIFTHLEVCSKKNNDAVIHHIDYNPENNNPTNLIEMTNKEHWELHSKNGHTLGLLWKNERDKMITGIRNYHDNRTEEQTETIINRNKNNGSSTWKKHREIVIGNLKQGRQNFKKKFETEDQYKKYMSYISMEYWDKISGEDFQLRQEKQINYNKKFKSYNINDDMFIHFTYLVTNGNNSLPKIKLALRKSNIFKDLFVENNKHLDKTPLFNFGDKFVYKLCKYGGYENFDSFKTSFRTNHKVIKVEFLDYMIDTGCLTIKDPGENHNFALSSGVFVKNSDGRGSKVETLPGGTGLGQLEDLEYFQKKVWRGLRIPMSYMTEGSEGAIFNDGKVGTAYIAELRFSLFIMRLQGYVERAIDKEFKNYLRKMNINVDETVYRICLPEPSNFGKYRQQEVDAAILAMFSGADAITYLSKRFILLRYLQLTEEEIIENEKLLREEKGMPPDTKNVNELPSIYGVTLQGEPAMTAMPGMGGELPPPGGMAETGAPVATGGEGGAPPPSPAI